MRTVEWMGIRTPMSIPGLQQAYNTVLTRREREALDAVEAACSTLIVWPGKTAFQIGPPQGFSKWYKWSWRENQYRAQMTDSDARLLFRGEACIEYEQFRDVDRPDHRNRQPPYPDGRLMVNMKINDPKSGNQYMVTQAQARIVVGLIRRFRRAPNLKKVASVGSRAYWTEGHDEIWYPEPLDKDKRFRGFKRLK